jgi:hypothetical protein
MCGVGHRPSEIRLVQRAATRKRKTRNRPMVDETGLEGYYDIDFRVPLDPTMNKSGNQAIFFDLLETWKAS